MPKIAKENAIHFIAWGHIS